MSTVCDRCRIWWRNRRSVRLTRRALPVPIDYVAVIIPGHRRLRRWWGIMLSMRLWRWRLLLVVWVLTRMRRSRTWERIRLWRARCIWVWLTWLGWRKWLSIGTIQLLTLRVLTAPIHGVNWDESLCLSGNWGEDTLLRESLAIGATAVFGLVKARTSNLGTGQRVDHLRWKANVVTFLRLQ